MSSPTPLPSAELPSPGASRELFLEGPAGRLQALLAAPRQEPVAGICLVCHPHPLYGGEMTNKVVHTLASCALKAGLLTARFNFRGVGRSEGSYDAARGETEDAVAVAEWLRRHLPQAPLVLGGFSFGAYVSLRAAAQLHPVVQISVSVPLRQLYDSSGDVARPEHPGCPWLAVHGTGDEVVDYDETRQALQGYQPAPQLATLEGAGHYYHGRLTELQQVVLPFLQAQLPS